MEEERTPQLQVSDLYKKRQTKDSARLKAYNQILEAIYHRIRVMSQLPNNPCNLLYSIPPFILGLPRIDLQDCVVYLVFQLRNAGFEVRYTFPNLINISWAHHERNYIVEQSPIMQAMLETSEAVKERERAAAAATTFGGGGGGGRRPKTGIITKKKQPKSVSFALGGPSGFRGASAGAGMGGLMRDSGAPTVGHMPSASEYVPPSTFLQTMERPKPKTDVVSSADALANLWKL